MERFHTPYYSNTDFVARDLAAALERADLETEGWLEDLEPWNFEIDEEDPE
jgi:hypothetical protein